MKLGRDVFLYLDPSATIEGEPRRRFAQCGPCRLFVPATSLPAGAKVKPDVDLCLIHGSQVAIDAELGSCGFFLPWPSPDGSADKSEVAAYAARLAAGIAGSVTTEQSGYVEHAVRCENCVSEEAKATHCGLYEYLNDKFPDQFDLDERIQPGACCNAQRPKPKKRR